METFDWTSRLLKKYIADDSVFEEQPHRLHQHCAIYAIVR